MRCPLSAVWVGAFVEAHEALLRSRSGADDESTEGYIAGHGHADHLVQAAEILGTSCRQLQRLKTRLRT